MNQVTQRFTTRFVLVLAQDDETNEWACVIQSNESGKTKQNSFTNRKLLPLMTEAYIRMRKRLRQTRQFPAPEPSLLMAPVEERKIIMLNGQMKYVGLGNE